MSNQVAEIILQQLGARRFVAMTGAKKLTARPNGLYFVVNRGKRFEVTLTAEDLYDVAYSRWNGRALEWVLIEESKGIFAEQLQEVFTRITGLDTRL